MFTINSEKLEKVVNLVNREIDPRATNDVVEQMICADWNEGEEHQDWLNNASVREVVDWISTFYN
jgi:broad-specificity NMP kinase